MRIRSGFGRWSRWLVVPALVLGLLTQAAPQAKADDPTAELNKAQDKLQYIQQQKQQVQNALGQAYWSAQEAQVQLQNVEAELNQANSQLAVITNQLTQAQADLKKVEDDLAATTKRYEEDKAMLAKRVRAINEEGRVNYLAVLLGASSFSDFISRFEMLKLVVKKDSQLFAAVKKDKQALEDARLEASARKTKLEDMKAQAEAARNTIVAKRDEKAQVSRSLDANVRSLRSQLDQLEQAEQQMQDQIWEIQQRMNRAAGSWDPVYPVKKPIIITDPFGMRMHPILHEYRMHYGTDFDAKMGAPVYAIESGVVIFAGWNDAYGNLVIIDHGGGRASWYGHASKLLVKVGDNVARGQQITQAGATGWATGPHLHLEIHINGKAVDPMTILPKL